MRMDAHEIINKDLKYVWHPCSQMKDYETFRPLVVSEARGCHLELANGQKIIDAISSWWCKSLGHQHPRLKNALLRQLEKFEHVILANTTHETIVNLSEKLCGLTTSLDKVFYAGDGSCAVEIALKMSLHSRQIQGKRHRHHFMALENSYHGETIGALSVSDLNIYSEPYRPLFFDCQFISPLPYVTGIQDPLWKNCESHWLTIEKMLEPWQDKLTAIIIEPLVQAAGGMKIYSADFLKRLRVWTAQHDIHLIADEIMTGFGRTGKMLACEHAGVEPDFLCLSKGLTSGWLPLSAVLTSTAIYNLFYADYAENKSFLHSHTFTGNALAAAVALEVFTIFEEEGICEQASHLGKLMHEYMQQIAHDTKKLVNVRSLGAITAADLIVNNPKERTGFAVYQKATQLGALLRPLGNTIYWVPPLIMDTKTLLELKTITTQAIMAVYPPTRPHRPPNNPSNAVIDNIQPTTTA